MNVKDSSAWGPEGNTFARALKFNDSFESA